MDDIIYRQDAIDACCFGITHARAINVETGEVVDLFESSNKELHKAIERIEALPTAHPTQSNAVSTCENTLDCVSRQAAIDAIIQGEPYGFQITLESIKALPSAQRKTGKWIKVSSTFAYCNQCGEPAPYWAMSSLYYLPNYCPDCGARMQLTEEIE